jgi:hypothetical protein
VPKMRAHKATVKRFKITAKENCAGSKRGAATCVVRSQSACGGPLKRITR